MSCERAVIRLGDGRILRFKCEGCEHGASIEGSEVCMREVVRSLAEHPEVSSVVLAGIYEREYSGSSLAELKKIAKIFRACKYWPFAHLAPTDCKRCEPERRQQLEGALETMPGDPARAREELEDIVRELRARSKRGAEKCRRCRATFIERALAPTLSALGRAELAGIGRKNREGYAKVLRALIRPCFMSSRLVLEPPAGAGLVDAYRVGGSEVRIYRLGGELQHLYFLVPPEHRLPREQVLLLHRARQTLLKQRPELELDPLRAREQLEHLGADLMAKLVVDEKLDIAREEVEELAQHLARFTAGLGVLEVLLADARVQDIYIDAPVGRTPIHIYHRDFEECLTNIHLTPEDAESLISRFRAISGRPFSEADPVLDLNLGGVRVAAIGHPLSPEGLAFALRRHKPTPWTLPQFIRVKFLTPYTAGLLSLLVDAQMSILVTGSRGAGKCLDGDTILQLGDGSLRRISEVVKEVIGKSKKIIDTEDGICCDLKQNGLHFKAFTLTHDLKIKSAKISKVWLRSAPSKMIRIKTRSGKEIVTTPEHPFFLLEKGEIVQKRADQLLVNEFIATPRKLPGIKNHPSRKEINWEELGEMKFVGPEKEAKELLSQLASRGEIKETANRLRISYRELRYLKNEADSIKPKTLALLRSIKNISSEVKGVRFPTSSGILPLNMTQEINEDCARFLGLLLSDGHLDEKMVAFFNRERDMLEEFGQLAEKLFGVRGKIRKPKNKCPFYQITSKPLALLIHKLFVAPFGNKSALVEIPREILCSADSIIAAFISAYFDCDGSVYFPKRRRGSKIEIELSTTSEKMSTQMQLALMRFGIISFKRKKLVRGKIYYTLVIRGEGCKHFFNYIGFREKRKKTLRQVIKNRFFNSNVDVVPNVFGLLRETKNEAQATFRVKFDQKNVGRKKLQFLAKNLRTSDGPASNRLVQLAFSDIFWDEIAKVEKIPYTKPFVYDLTIDGTHNFVANGFIAHNTSLLGALMLELLPKFRVITLEDTSELPIEQLRALGFKIQSLRVQSAVSGTSAELRAEDALRAALRLGESILIVGEVRGKEAQTLYEAMRVGAAGNSVMGTIHGATTRDVFERVVYDLGIPPSSFKATNAIVVATPIRPRGSITRMRRVAQITEVRKDWREDPMSEEGFEDLMRYDPEGDKLEPTRALTGLKSQLIEGIARKWSTKPREVLRNLELRAEVQGALVETATRLKKPELLEAEFSVRSNLVLHALLEEQLLRKRVDYRDIFRHWREWLTNSTREISQGCEV